MWLECSFLEAQCNVTDVQHSPPPAFEPPSVPGRVRSDLLGRPRGGGSLNGELAVKALLAQGSNALAQ